MEDVPVHPIRKAELHVFVRTPDNYSENGVTYMAHFWPYKTFPIYFKGDDHEAVVAAAESFRSDALAKHESAYVSRREAAIKAQATRKSKATP